MPNRKPPRPIPSDTVTDGVRTPQLSIGVCYTPTAVVDYMVENTIGRLLADKTPQQLLGNLRILDPACGEGIFLIRAYAYLLAWYRDRYIAAYERGDTPTTELPLQRATDGTWELAIAERWRILQEHIYGVDIDAQAVAQAQFHLLEMVAIPTTNHTSYSPPSLPNYSPGGHTRKGGWGGQIQSSQFDLGQNLKCGNAIISEELGDRYPASFPINSNQAFNWQVEFP